MRTESNSLYVQGNIYAFLGMIIWAMTYPLTDVLLGTWHPLTLAATRIFGAGFILFLVSVLVQSNYVGWKNWPFKKACATAVVGLGLSTISMNFAFQYSNPINIAVIATTGPLVSAVMGMIRGEEQITIRLFFAIVMAIAGGILVSVSNLETELGFQGGEILMIIAVVLWVWFSRVSVTKLRVIPAFPRMALMSLIAGIVISPFLILIELTGLTSMIPIWSGMELLLPIVLIFGVAFSMVFWMMSADRIGVTIAGMHGNAVPFYVVLIMIFFGGSVNSWQIIGAILVATGATLAQLNIGKLKDAVA